MTKKPAVTLTINEPNTFADVPLYATVTHPVVVGHNSDGTVSTRESKAIVVGRTDNYAMIADVMLGSFALQLCTERDHLTVTGRATAEELRNLTESMLWHGRAFGDLVDPSIPTA